MQNNKLMMIIIIALLVILILAIGGLAFYFMTSINKGEEAPVAAPSVVELSQAEITDFELEPIKTNLFTSPDGSDHAISVSFVLGINNKEKESGEFLTMLAAKEKLARSIALTIVKSKTYQEMKRPDAEVILADEVLARLQEEFNTNLIVRVAVYDMYTQ